MDVSNVNDDDDDGDVAVEENANHHFEITELREELRRMDTLQESLVREVVLRGR